MSDTRSLTPLSEMDYEAIAAAVMETGRGRWFLAEYARRNRQADTTAVLAAIERLDSFVREAAGGVEAGGDAATGPAVDDGTGLSAHVQDCTARILSAVEDIQEAAWSLRENGAAGEICDRIDRRSTVIHLAASAVEAVAARLGRLAAQPALPMPAMAMAGGRGMARHSPTDPADIDVVEIETQARMPLTDGAPSHHARLRRRGSSLVSERDLLLAEPGAAPEPLPEEPAATSASVDVSYSEADLRAIGALPVQDRLRFFA